MNSLSVASIDVPSTPPRCGFFSIKRRRYRFGAHLDRHEVRTASQQGWATFKNGDLLTAAEAAGFEVLLTTDKNLRYQQNLEGRKIAVIVLGRQQWPQVSGHVQRIVNAVNSAAPGSYAEIEIPSEKGRG